MIGGHKDLELILDTAYSAQCPLDIAAIITNKINAAIDADMAYFYWSSLQEITRL